MNPHMSQFKIPFCEVQGIVFKLNFVNTSNIKVQNLYLDLNLTRHIPCARHVVIFAENLNFKKPLTLMIAANR